MADRRTFHFSSDRAPHYLLNAGALLVVTNGGDVTTLLGPCVTVTLWNRNGVAAICHAMLPEPLGLRRAEVAPDSRRWIHVNEAIPELFARFAQAGGTRGAFEVKLFGGANLLGDAWSAPTMVSSIGARNVDQAMASLDECALRLHASDVGGRQGRKVVFDTRTGDVAVKLMSSR